MGIYANDNGGMFPVVPYAPYTAALNNPTSTLGGTTQAGTISEMFASPPANVAGSPTAPVWLLVLNNYVSPKQLTCKDDSFLKGVSLVTAGTRYQMNLSSGSHLSYSFAYPYTADGKVGGWWRETLKSDLPLMSDMAPWQGTGSPVKVLDASAEQRNPKVWNSVNHSGDGQSVGFADAHAEWTRRPDVGQNNDNIFTTSGTGLPQRYGGTAATPVFPGIPALPAAAGEKVYGGPYDVIMVPVRNATTGGM